MKGLGGDIQNALDIIIEGLNFQFNIDLIDSDKIKSSMESKITSFRIAKELLFKWHASPNSPSESKFEKYVNSIIDSGELSLETLRKALSAKIDYNDLDEHKHKTAMEAKLLILNSINEMDASVQELRIQLENGTVNLKTSEFKRGYAEKYAAQEFYPLKNYYKKWHNKEENAIVIDAKGSRGEIIELDGLRIQLPHPPRDKSIILFSDKPKKEQYWRREEIPKGLTPDNADVYTEYILEQFKRRREGVWFMNNGTPTYLNGRYWFQLQWSKMLDGGNYPDYRDAQRMLAYHKEACYVDNECLGQIFLKARQTGYTYGSISDSNEIATSTENIHNGLTSMVEEMAAKAFLKQSYGFQELPFFFQPIVKGKIDSPKKLEFGKPSNSSKETKKKKDTTTKGYLNSNITYDATKVKAYDGSSLKYYLGDECFAKDTKILMGDISFKTIQDIKVGDKVIVEGGTTQEVGMVRSGVTQMYKVIQPHGKDYVVSENHRLFFEKGNGQKSTIDIVMTPIEYNNLDKYNKRITRRKVFTGIDFEEKECNIPPYIIGAWLGGGFTKQPQFIVNHRKDKEILEEIEKFAKDKELTMSLHCNEENFQKWYLKDDTQYRNRFNQWFRDLGIFEDKRIPKEAFKYSIKQRLELLAGIIDTDGYKDLSNRFTIGMSRKGLVEDIYNIAKSCGLDTSEIKHSKSNFNTDVYTLSMTDYDAVIPNRVERKKPTPTKKVNRKGRVEDVVKMGIREYYGITLKTDSDRYRCLVLEDYTLSMNCAKWGKISYIEHFNTILPTMLRGGRVTGKCFLGSTMGKLSEGGEDFKVLYLNSKVSERDNITGLTPTRMYSYFISASKNYESCIDIYGKCWEDTPPKGTLNTFGNPITRGALELIREYYESAKKQGDIALNAAYRAFPLTEAHAMRDEAETCVFNLNKLVDQFDYNDTILEHRLFVRGNFEWKNNVRFSSVEWYPDERGRFKVAWFPSVATGTLKLQNNVKQSRGVYYPQNDYGCIGLDCYGSYVAGVNKQSKGAAHGYSRTNFVGAPQESFFFEYLDKPPTQDIFNEDHLKAAWFYGIPILAENNRRDFVRYIYLANCRPFSMNRPDKTIDQLQGDDGKLGGVPMQSKDMLDSHENAIRTYIQKRVGQASDSLHREEGEMGLMPFNNTLSDWMKFNPTKRTAFDLTISSGLALMGCQREKYKPAHKIRDPKRYVPLLRKFSNSGDMGELIK